ncbi:MAG: hypothetical protein IPM38_17720 [Ignavibacteria bacterium]|nr:hypothetical protein [Ignavibacteria bacterium]
MKINPTSLSGFNNWKILILRQVDTVKRLVKVIQSYAFLGDFMLGEGKLFRLAPVMQEGGTLVADESINNINFNCNGDVSNNGKNISLYVGTIVNFADGVKWNIDGGEFKTGRIS